MITNPDKYQEIILGNTNYTFNFKVNDINIPVKDNIDPSGVNIDKNLHFNSRVKKYLYKGQQSNYCNFPLSKNGTHRFEV